MSFPQHPHQGQPPYQAQYPYQPQWQPQGHWTPPPHPQSPQSSFPQHPCPPSVPVPPVATGAPYPVNGYLPHPSYQGGYSDPFQSINQCLMMVSTQYHFHIEHCCKKKSKLKGIKKVIKAVFLDPPKKAIGSGIRKLQDK